MNKELVQINQAKTALTEARDLDDMEFHEIADIFPMMIGDDYRALHDSIAEIGCEEPITFYEGKILDGRNRYTACLETNTSWESVEYEGDSPVGFVVRKNLYRRQLTSSQRAVASLRALPRLEAEAKKRQGERTDLTSVKDFTEVKRATKQVAKLFDTILLRT